MINSTSDKRVLVITCHKLDENNGGANASKGYLHCIASLFADCSLIYPEFPGTLPYIPSAYKLYPCHDSRPKIQKGIDMYRGVVSGLHGCVRRHLRDHRYDLVFIDHSVTATSLLKSVRATGARVVTIHHNVERDYLRDNGSQRPLTYRLPYNYFARKAERDSLLFSDVNLTISGRDAAVFRSWYQGRDIHVHPWGCFEYRPLPDKSFPPKAGGRAFVITGSLAFRQSLVPIIEFIRRYWPLVRREYPGARLTIAGRNPDVTLIEACSAHGDISIVANPADMDALVREADYYICPINAGSGVKLRVADGLRQGLAVLCHEVSVAGYEHMTANKCLFAYHDEGTFTAALRHLVADHATADTVYRTYRESSAVETGTERLRNILRQESIIP